MGQKKIVLEFTEAEARIVEYALTRAALVAPRQMRGRLFEQKLKSAQTRVQQACEGLKILPPVNWRR